MCLAVNYLLRKHDDASAAAPILVFYFLLLIAWLSSFGRLWYMITFDPPYLPLGENAPIKQKIPLRRRRESELAGQEYDGQIRADEDSEKQRNDPDSPGLEKFYTKNVFVANMDGKPKWCSQCANWKPDRTHHCSDAGRCIYKMDHYCPWYACVTYRYEADALITWSLGLAVPLGKTISNFSFSSPAIRR